MRSGATELRLGRTQMCSGQTQMRSGQTKGGFGRNKTGLGQFQTRAAAPAGSSRCGKTGFGGFHPVPAAAEVVVLLSKSRSGRGRMGAVLDGVVHRFTAA